MLIKINTCSCLQCRLSKRHHRKKDKRVTRSLNKKLRRENYLVCKGVKDEVELSKLKTYFS